MSAQSRSLAGIEVSGGTIHGYLVAFGHFRSLGSQLLLAEGIGTKGADGMAIIDPEAWYPAERFLSIFTPVVKQLGDSTLHQIGVGVMKNIQWPPGMNTVEALVRMIDFGYHMHHRRHGRPMADPATQKMQEGIGHYVGRVVTKDSYAIDVDSVYPCMFDKGLLFGAVRRIGAKASILHDDSQPCRSRGAEKCTYLVRDASAEVSPSSARSA
jgi:hypothetical protein